MDSQTTERKLLIFTSAFAFLSSLLSLLRDLLQPNFQHLSRFKADRVDETVNFVLCVGFNLTFHIHKFLLSPISTQLCRALPFHLLCTQTLYKKCVKNVWKFFLLPCFGEFIKKHLLYICGPLNISRLKANRRIVVSDSEMFSADDRLEM